MTMLSIILVHTPAWVWVLLAALLALGLWQTRPQRVSRGRLLLLPLAILGLGLWTTGRAFAAVPLVAAAWALALAAATTLAARRPPAPGARWLPRERRLLRPGSWLPLAVIAVIFSLRYAMGVGVALHPAWQSMLALQLPAALVFGAVSGLLLGRSLALLRLAHPPTITADERLPA